MQNLDPELMNICLYPMVRVKMGLKFIKQQICSVGKLSEFQDISFINLFFLNIWIFSRLYGLDRLWISNVDRISEEFNFKRRSISKDFLPYEIDIIDLPVLESLMCILVVENESIPARIGKNRGKGLPIGYRVLRTTHFCRNLLANPMWHKGYQYVYHKYRGIHG